MYKPVPGKLTEKLYKCGRTCLAQPLLGPKGHSIALNCFCQLAETLRKSQVFFCQTLRHYVACLGPCSIAKEQPLLLPWGSTAALLPCGGGVETVAAPMQLAASPFVPSLDSPICPSMPCSYQKVCSPRCRLDGSACRLLAGNNTTCCSGYCKETAPGRRQCAACIANGGACAVSAECKWPQVHVAWHPGQHGFVRKDSAASFGSQRHHLQLVAMKEDKPAEGSQCPQWHGMRIFWSRPLPIDCRLHRQPLRQ